MACSTVFYSLGTREVFAIEFSTGTRSDKQIFGQRIYSSTSA